jgi:large subunit ribosomal protein L23
MTTETNKIAKATYIKKPRSTEKAIIATDNKDNLRQEILKTYKVSPTKINIVNTPDKVVMRKGRPGKISGFKKAIVTLKKGDKIDVI